MAKIFSIGIGPGDIELITEQAKKILEHVDTIMGYNRLIHHLDSLMKGKAIYSSGLNKESDLAEKALEIARQGKDVAVLSRGDSCVYGMAVILQNLVSKEENIELQIVPGIPDFISASAMVGTPLVDEFATLSLSTRLTPLATIEFRARLLAQTDLAIVMYYPPETESPEVLQSVLDIFSSHRPAGTAVAIIKKPHRKNQEVISTTLESVFTDDINEFSIIIICSEESRIVDEKIQGKAGYIFY